MNRIVLGVGLTACLVVAGVIAHQGSATAEQSDQLTSAAVGVPALAVPAEAATSQAAETYPACTPQNASTTWTGNQAGNQAEPYKKCSFNSDCKYGKCKSGKCGSCSFNSDCKGWGKCKSGKCGACSFQSECKGFGGCSSGRCKKSPY